jgi:hypothetical protein
VIVLALAVAVVVDRPGRKADPSRSARLFPELTPEAVTAIRFTRVGEPEVRLEREAGTLVLTAPARLPTDPQVVRELLASLESLASRGRGTDTPEAGLDPPAFTVTVSWGGTEETLVVGRRQPAIGRTYVKRRGEIFAVDDYAARALDRRVDDLRRRHPFPDPARGNLTIGRVGLQGECLAVAGEGGCARADAAEVAAIRERMSRLRVTRFLPGGNVEGTNLAVGPVAITLGGECPGAPDDRIVSGAELGTGCIPAEEADYFLGLDRNPTLLLDRSLLGLAPGLVRRLTVSGGLALERGGGGWRLGGKEPADTDAVDAWLEELASYRAGEAEPLPPLAAPPAGAVVLEVEDDAGGRVTTWIVPGNVLVVRRPGDGVALLFHPDLLPVLRREPVRFADHRVLEFDPFAVAAVSAVEAGVTERAERGATQDRWKLTSPLATAADGDVIATLRESASSLRASEVVADRPAAAHDLEPPRRLLRFELDDGEAALGLGRALDDGRCYARRLPEARVYLLPAADCKVLGTRLASRQVFDADSRDVLSVSVGAERWEHQGPSWYDARGQRVAGEVAVRLAALVRHLANTPGVAGYGDRPGGLRVVLTTARGEIVLRAGGGEYVVEGRPVRYRASPELCQRWPALCLERR